MTVIEKFKTMEYGPAPEDPKESVLWLDRHGRRFGHFISGTWQAPLAGQYFETADPSTGEKIADVAQGSAADIDAAVKAARAALPGWQARKPLIAPAFSTPWRGTCKSIPAASRFSKRSITASPFAKAATLIFRWSPGISIITPAGRSFSIRNSPAASRAAWWARSFRGIFRC